MHDYAATRLRTILLRAFRESEHYRAAWRAAGVEEGDLARFEPEDLSRLPLLTRDVLRETPRSLLTSAASGAPLHWFSSSGSTGSPVHVCRTESEWQSAAAAREARSLNWAGASILGSRAMIGGRAIAPGPRPRPPYHRYNFAEKQVYFTAFHIRPSTAASYLEGLRRYRPRLFTGYAHSYYFLAAMMLEQGLSLDFQPDAIVLGSERLTCEMRATIESAFGRRPFEEYGSVEHCALITECERGGLHLNVDFGWLEVVDDRGRPVRAGETGRLICTGLLNEAQPLVRYAIGDVGGFSAQPCPCGRGCLPTMLPIEGRLEDAVYGPDGRRIVRLDAIFRDLPQIIEGQIVQERADRFRVKVVLAGELGQSLSETLSSRMRMRLGDVRVHVERTDQIPRTHSGKFRAVVNLLPEEEKQRLLCLPA
jgi:phenylacetate-CoA ligase